MNINKSGLDLIKNFEGLRLKAYRCPSNILTIGYGHTGGVREGQVITKEKAEELLKADLSIFEQGVRKNVKVPLNENQFSALVSFVFNIGLAAFIRSTLLRILNSGDYKGAAGQFDRWVRGGGKVLPGLVRRRAAEKELFLKKP